MAPCHGADQLHLSRSSRAWAAKRTKAGRAATRVRVPPAAPRPPPHHRIVARGKLCVGACPGEGRGCSVVFAMRHPRPRRHRQPHRPLRTPTIPVPPARSPLQRVLARKSHSAPRRNRQPHRPVRTPTIPAPPPRSPLHRVLARKSHSAPRRNRQPRRPVRTPTIPVPPARSPLQRVLARKSHSAPRHNRQPRRPVRTPTIRILLARATIGSPPGGRLGMGLASRTRGQRSVPPTWYDHAHRSAGSAPPPFAFICVHLRFHLLRCLTGGQARRRTSQKKARFGTANERK
jgi:hypothetical protein